MAKRLKRTPAQTLLGIHLREFGYAIQYEYQFNPDRKWRADIAIPSERLLFECDGGMFRGGHRRGQALALDYERQNWAVMNGWRMIRFTNQQILLGEAKKFLAEWMGK